MSLAAVGAAVVFTVLCWWFGTGAILWLDRLPRATFRWSLIGASALAAASIYGLFANRSNLSPTGAVLGFACALGVWSWHELCFLTGVITGPRTTRCPPEATGWRRFVLATSTLIYHEVALFATALFLLAMSWNQPNQIGAWTFLILLVARLSAKLNIFLGVPNFADTFFPDHLRYLASYLRRSPTNALFPLSITAGCALAVGEAWLAFHPGVPAFDMIGFSLLFALTSLAVIEHAFMVLPIQDTALWRWALPPSAKNSNGPALDR
jgi:putative photosynthetic complex assembly protein 2